MSEYDLSRNEIALLNRYSSGLISLCEFADNAIPYLSYFHSRSSGLVKGNALGLTGRYDRIRPELSPYSIACKAFELIHYDNFSNEYGLDIAQIGVDDYTSSAMTVLTNSPLPLVFFIPPKLRTHKHANWTAAEMSWAINNFELIGNMTFVFGLHEFISDNGIQEPGEINMCAQLLIDTLSQV